MSVRSCLLILFLVFMNASPILAAPELAAPAKAFDFRTIKEGEKVDHIFRFENVGDAPLQVEKIRSSCGCTAAMVSTRTIAPGESAELKVTFDSTGFRGKVQKTVTVLTNDPLHPRTGFTMQGVVTPLVGLNPLRLRFNNLVEGTPQTQKVIMTNNSEVPLKITGLKTTNAKISVDLPVREIAPGKAAEMDVTAAWKSGERRLSGYVLLQTDHPKVNMIRMVVRGYPKP